MPAVASPPHFRFVDAMRGYAILGVILFHVGQVSVGTYPWLSWIASYGGNGVQLFFVISAFALFWSLANRRTTDRRPLLSFFARRVFRVVPLFWLGILFYLGHPDFWRDQFAPNGVGTWHILSSFLFLHGWYPTTINSVVPGGWSIAAEMMFYLTLPLMFRKITSLKQAYAVAMLSSIVVAVGSPVVVGLLSTRFPREWFGLIQLFVNFSFPAQFPVFCWGIVLYFLITADDLNRKRWVAILMVSMLPFIVGPAYLLLAILFALLSWCLSQSSIRILVHPLVRSVGVISYSMYLWHFFVLDWLGPQLAPSLLFNTMSRQIAGTLRFAALYFVITGVTILLATASYYLIEKPGINFGRWLISRLGWGPLTERSNVYAATSAPSGAR